MTKRKCPWCGKKQYTNTEQIWGKITCSCGKWTSFNGRGIIEASGSIDNDKEFHVPTFHKTSAISKKRIKEIQNG